MERSWSDKQNILCIRLDNMGDLLMSSPAIRALKETFNSRITILTSSMAGKIAGHLSFIDEVIVSDVPWVKSTSNNGATGFYELVEQIRKHHFDAAMIFTVFSQNPMPAIMLAYLAGIPARLAYCRENPYDLLTEWIPDKEPYTFIHHQVIRDLALVKHVGAEALDDKLTLEVPDDALQKMKKKLTDAGISIDGRWIMVHPFASERKREFPAEPFKQLLIKLIDELDADILITGTAAESKLAGELCVGIEGRIHDVTGMLSLEEFMALIQIAPVVLSVNTGTVHIAAALQTPVVVLYAQTNPQHTPWKTPSEVFTFPVEEELQSRNEILKFVSSEIMEDIGYPDLSDVVQSVRALMRTAHLQHAQQARNLGVVSSQS